MKIGKIKACLQAARRDMPVYFDFCKCVPTTIENCRGSEAKPAIGWSPSGYSGAGKVPSVQDVLDELNIATSDKIYHPWKGNDVTFTYTDQHTLCVDNFGDQTGTEIVSIEVGQWCVTIHTKQGRRWS